MRISRFVFPVLILTALFGGYALRLAFTQPTTMVAFDQAPGETSVFIVDGVKCQGTAAYFTSMYDSVPGIISIETFASEHKAIFTYDPSVISTDSIKAVMETPVHFDDGTSAQAFKCLSIE
jgi:hypothetical protein